MKQELGTSDEIGVACKITIRRSNGYEYRFAKLEDSKFNKYGNGDIAYVITPSEHSKIMELINTTKTTPPKPNSDEVEQDMEQTIDNAELINGYEKELQSKDKIIGDLTTSNNEKDKTIAEYKARIDALGKEADELKSKLDNTIDASELEDLKTKLKYWQEAYGTLSDEHLGTVDENESLRKSNEDINKTNKLLNANITSLNTTFDETKEQLTSDFEKQEKELKETIKNNQSHIDELTEKYESLLPLKEYIPQKQYYQELNALKSKLSDAENELNKTNAEIETKLATQKSDLEIQHTKEKAQLLVAYNKDIDQQKLKYNELAKDYNHLLNDACSLSRINTFLNGKHNDIVKDKTPVELEVIASEQLPPSDENVVEFVPKNEKQE